MQIAYDRGAEYVFPADQDDVWHDDKLERLMDRMRLAETASGGSSPQLVYSDLTVVDGELHRWPPPFCVFPGFDTARAGRCGPCWGVVLCWAVPV